MQKSIAETLIEHGLRPSPQRVAVATYLHAVKTHPNAETVYQALAPEYPTLSRTTVYQTLEKLCARGVARKINIEDGEMRFDADISNHGHFKCITCGQVFDFYFGGEAELPKPPPAFSITEQHLYYKGICSSCTTSSSTKEPSL